MNRYLNRLSTVRKSRKYASKRLVACVRSSQPIISRMLCMDSCGMPTSTARMPVFVDSLDVIDVETSYVESADTKAAF